tara:strand:+ start:927 stop:1253 length:327 start_codon:yes stop_codon:yes gene_type:complete
MTKKTVFTSDFEVDSLKSVNDPRYMMHVQVGEMTDTGNEAVRVRIEKGGRFMASSPTMTAEVLASAIHGMATGRMIPSILALPLALRRRLYLNLIALSRVVGGSLPPG